MNGIFALLTPQQFAMLYPLIMIPVCVFPPLLFLYMLHFTESRFAGNKIVNGIMYTTMSIALVILFTNPIHQSLISGYDDYRPITGDLFLVHALLSYIPVFITIIVFMRYYIKSVRKVPALTIVMLAIIIPISFNIFFTTGLIKTDYDLTPFPLIAMIAVFAAYSIYFKLFSVKEVAYANIFSSVSDALIVVNNSGLVADINQAFRNVFPNFDISVEKTLSEQVTEYMKQVTIENEPANLFEIIHLHDIEIRDGEITVQFGEDRFTYAVSKNIINYRGQ
jgi:hypothetical protein